VRQNNGGLPKCVPGSRRSPIPCLTTAVFMQQQMDGVLPKDPISRNSMDKNPFPNHPYPNIEENAS
jgi:hypothetical protein